VIHRGPMWENPDALSALFAWIGKSGYSSAGPYTSTGAKTTQADTPGDLDSVVIEMQLRVAKTSG
jgi:hypothetical protein